MKKLYAFYRPEVIWTMNLNGISLNWKYTLNFFILGQYNDYITAWLISIKDNEIPNDRYVKELAHWIKDLREFVYMEYDNNYISDELITTIVKKIGAKFDLELLDIEQAKSFIRKNTDLKEVEEWKFLIQDKTIWLNWEDIEAKYLIIN